MFKLFLVANVSVIIAQRRANRWSCTAGTLCLSSRWVSQPWFILRSCDRAS